MNRTVEMSNNRDWPTDDGRCPLCGSDRITEFRTYDMVIGRNMKSGKMIYRDKHPENGDTTFASHKCRLCGWVSAGYVP